MRSPLLERTRSLPARRLLWQMGGDASSTPEIQAGIEGMNDVVRRVGRELEVPVFEFAERFPEDPGLFVGKLGLALDVDPPTRETMRETGVLPFSTDRE